LLVKSVGWLIILVSATPVFVASVTSMQSIEKI